MIILMITYYSYRYALLLFLANIITYHQYMMLRFHFR